LKSIFASIDADHDGKLSAAEISARVEQLRAKNVSIHTVACKVLLNGVPLPEATVTLIPVTFWADSLPRATGTTSPEGLAALSAAPEAFPDPHISGVYGGLYRVEISKVQNGRELIPAKYNTASVLGQMIPNIQKNGMPAEIVYDLKSSGS
jgi:hypothetical protein